MTQPSEPWFIRIESMPIGPIRWNFLTSFSYYFWVFLRCLHDWLNHGLLFFLLAFMFKAFLTYRVEYLATSNMILLNAATEVSRSLNFWFSKSWNFLRKSGWFIFWEYASIESAFHKNFPGKESSFIFFCYKGSLKFYHNRRYNWTVIWQCRKFMNFKLYYRL